MFNCQRQTRNHQPDNVQDQRGCAAAIGYFLAEGEETQACKFEALFANRYAHDGNTPEYSRQAPAYPADKPAEDKP